MTFVQKILVDFNHQQEFAMKQKRKKDVGIVTFYLIGLLPTNHIIYIIYYGIPEFYKETFDVYSLPCLPESNTPSNRQPFLHNWSLCIQDNLKDRAVGNFICLRTYLYVLGRWVTSHRTYIYTYFN